MEPTYRDNSFRLGNALMYTYRDPSPGDVVIIKMAGRRMTHLKRVLAVPGETVAFRRGELRVDGQSRPEAYIVYAGTWNMPEMTLREDEYFVAGDNRAMPMEWHTLGVVERSRIMGGLLF